MNQIFNCVLFVNYGNPEKDEVKENYVLTSNTPISF